MFWCLQQSVCVCVRAVVQSRSFAVYLTHLNIASKVQKNQLQCRLKVLVHPAHLGIVQCSYLHLSIELSNILSIYYYF